MSVTAPELTLEPLPGVSPAAGEVAARTAARALPGRLLRGRPDDPAWARPCLLVLLAATAVAYLFALGDSGWANSFYSAAVQAGTKSWKAFFFGSSDASNFITVDKPPASLWVMELSARVFGLSSWSILVPQALEGVATVGVLYATVRRFFGAGAGLLAGTVLALTPVAALMFRYNNPDALLVLLLTAAVYATVRALERGSTWWLVAAGVLLGTGFLTKMLQAFLVLPAILATYGLFAPAPLRRRLRQLLATVLAVVVSAGWWVMAVQLTPAADRPYIGGSQDNSLWNLIFGYNGFGRISGSETGSVGGGGAAGMWGPTGWDRLFTQAFGGQISWLIPAAVVLSAACFWLGRRAPHADRTRVALTLWGGVFVVSAATISFGRGIIHPYYTVALAPSLGALCGIGATRLWSARSQPLARAALALALGGSAVWAFVLMDRAPHWMPPLRLLILVAGLALVPVVLLVHRLGPRPARVLGAAAVTLALAGMSAWTLDTVNTPHSGAIPSAGPSLVATAGAPGGLAGGAAPGAGAAGGLPGRGAGPGGGGQGGPPATGSGPGASGGRTAPGSSAPGSGARSGTAGGGPTGAGGFLDASTPGKALVRLLEDDAGAYRWVAAVVNSNSAAGYQLASGDPVMAIGGFNGTDPAPSLVEFERFVADREVHYFIASGGGLGSGGSGTDASSITAWVEAHFRAETVDGVTLYDLASS